MIGPLIVDAHHHLWDPTRHEYPWLASEPLAPIRRSYTLSDARYVMHDIECTVLVQTISSTAETEEFLRTAAESDGLIGGVVGWVDLGSAVAAELDRLRAVAGGQFLVGVRHQVEDEPDPEWLLRKEVLAGLRAVGDAGLVYDLLVRVPQRPAALTAARQLPEVSFVLDHAGKPGIADREWDGWASWIADLAELPNVTCKLSGLITEARWTSWSPKDIRPYADHVLDCFGPDRVLFGSDWPVCELAGSYADVLTLTNDVLHKLSTEEQTDVLSANAQRIYLNP